jgi:TetR/AcrR family transcriptional regulator
VTAADQAGSREKILEVAEALFARRGFAGVGLREVAETAGLGKSSLFHHFESKPALYFAVLGRVMGRIEDALRPVFASGGPPLARLDRLIDTLIDGLAEHPASARLLLRAIFEDDDWSPDDPPPGAEVAERSLETLIAGLEALLREGVKSGAFREVSARHMVQTLIGATVYHFASGEFGDVLLGRPLLSSEEVRRRKHEVKALLHHGLAAPAARPTSGGPS